MCQQCLQHMGNYVKQIALLHVSNATPIDSCKGVPNVCHVLHVLERLDASLTTAVASAVASAGISTR